MSNTAASDGRGYIKYARQLSSTECYSKAFDVYLLAFEKSPATKHRYEKEFRILLSKFNEMLASTDKINEILSNFSRADFVFPGNMYLMNEIGKYLFKFGFYMESLCQFRKALKVDGAFVNAEKNMNSVKNLLVERWHFRMLNDKIRNTNYRSAIKELIKSEDIVFDLGSGTGLLSLYARECKPKYITACDSSEVMANISSAMLGHKLNGSKFFVIHQNSTKLGPKDIKEKHTILITELFDAGLLGEHILPTLSHAWKNILAAGAKVIPSIVQFNIIGVQCKELLLKYQLCSTIKNTLNISSYNIHILQNEDTYDCDDIHLYKNLKYMTDAECILTVDLNNVINIDRVIENSEPMKAQFTALEDGEIDCLIGWFYLILSSRYTIATDPRSSERANAWQQAVFYDHLPKQVKKGEKFTSKFSLGAGSLALVPDPNIMRISPEVLRFLNDTELMNKILSCMGLASVYLGQIIEMSDMRIVDLSPFPMFGFQMLKRGAKSLICWARTEFDQHFMEEVFKANDIDLTKITYLIGDDWNKDNFSEEKYHAIFCIMLELEGDIDQKLWEIGLYLKQTYLLPGGLFLPHKISIIAQIVQCNWLNITNRVYDENHGTRKISKYINKYQVSQNFSIDYSLLDYTPITDPECLGEVINMTSNVLNIPVYKKGDANCILCWYNVELMENMGDMTTMRPCCFIDGTTFLADPSIAMKPGDIANILYCVDPDGSFKLMIALESG